MTEGTPVVTVVHTLPGRVRFRLSRKPSNTESLLAAVRGHEGVASAVFTPTSRSVLVHFDPGEVAKEEVVMGLGLAFALDQGATPVRVFSRAPAGELTDSAFYSGMLLVLTLALRYLRKGSGLEYLETIASLTTAGSVIGHGWSEVRSRGTFDPEVLSVVWLLMTIARGGGRALPAAIVTWLSTFARHLVQAPPAGVEIRPIESGDSTDSAVKHEVVLSTVWPRSGGVMALTMLSSALRYVVSGTGAAPKTLLDEIQSVAKQHGAVLEDLEGRKGKTPVRFHLPSNTCPEPPRLLTDGEELKEA